MQVDGLLNVNDILNKLLNIQYSSLLFEFDAVYSQGTKQFYILID